MSHPIDYKTTGALDAQSGIPPQSSALFEPILFRAGVIHLAAYRSNTELWRIERLARVAHAAADQGLPVTHLHDSKGRLSVAFSERITASLIESVSAIWRDQGKGAVGGFYEHGRLVKGTNLGLEFFLPKTRYWLIDGAGDVLGSELELA